MSSQDTSGPKVHNVHTYTNWGCRCADCKAALAAYTKERRAKRKALMEARHNEPKAAA